MPALTNRLPPSWRETSFVAILFATFLFGVGTPMVQTFTVTKVQAAAGETTALSGPANIVSKGTPILIVALCLFVIVAAFAEGVPRTGFANLVVLIAPWTYLVVHDKYLGISPHLRVLCYPLICIAVWCLRPKLSALRWLGYLVGFTAVLSLLMGFFLAQKGVYQAADGTEISPDKAVLSGILVGPFASGNNLGQFLVMGTASILAIPRRKWRWLLFAACVYAQVWAASRSCLVALGVLVVLGLSFRFFSRRTAAALAGAILLAMAFLVAYLPFSTTDESAYSNRGYVWKLSKQAWSAAPDLGLGSTFFSRIALTSSTLGGSVFHAHNQFLQDLVTGGWALALLMGVLVAAAIRVAVRWARQGAMVPALYLVGLLGACLMEVSFVLVDRFFAMPVTVVPLACIFFSGDGELPLRDRLETRGDQKASGDYTSGGRDIRTATWESLPTGQGIRGLSGRT